MTTNSEAPLFEVTRLVKRFPLAGTARILGRRREMAAVDGVSFSVASGGALGIVGESGCGKSTLARAALRLIEPDEGAIRLGGEDFRALRGADLRVARRRAQLVFQDSGAALDARMRVGEQLREPIRAHGLVERKNEANHIAEQLERVGLAPSLVDRYPHQLSGGQRQRLAIARALVTEPELLVLDEPVSSLDVSVQARILALLASLRRGGIAMVLISHDLTVVDQLVDDVAVMYFGRVIEYGPRSRVFQSPRHPYTAGLLAAVPASEVVRGFAEVPVGEVPSPITPPAGCPFHPRCPIAVDLCRRVRPALEGPKDLAVACHAPLDMAGRPKS